MIDIGRLAPLPGPEPVLVKGHAADRLTEGAEGVDVAVALAAPVAKLDAQLVGSLGLAHEVGLVEAQLGVESPDVRHGGFADADRADLGGLDQFDRRRRIAQHRREAGGGHPAGGAAADDDDFTDLLSAGVFHGHVSFSPRLFRRRHVSGGLFQRNSALPPLSSVQIIRPLDRR
jgi:hypothetical protein